MPSIAHVAVTPTTPPQVTDSFTATGAGLATAVAPLTVWAIEHRDRRRAARAAWDSTRLDENAASETADRTALR
jgi:DNA-binding HxlR family transcriptional regulator